MKFLAGLEVQLWEKDSCHCQTIPYNFTLFAQGTQGFWVVFGAFVMLYCCSTQEAQPAHRPRQC